MLADNYDLSLICYSFSLQALRLSKEVSSAVDDVLMKVNKLRSMKASKDMVIAPLGILC